MSRIAVKIFLAFWLTFFLVVTGFSLVLELLRTHENVQPLGEFQQRQLQQHQEQIQGIYQRRGLPGLRRFAQDIQDNRGITLFLLDDQGKNLLEADVPALVLAYFHGKRLSKTPQMQMRDRRLLIGPAATSDASLQAHILLWLPMAAGEASTVGGLWRGRYVGWQIAFSLILSGIVSLALSLSLTRPLNRLERAANRLAQGRFDTSDIAMVARRKDEIGGLAKEFKLMAGRLDNALKAQQRLLRDVSHELRSPLTRLQVAIGLASRQAPAGNSVSFERMENECERLNALIGEVLALARADGYEQEITAQEFDLALTLQALTSDAKFETQAQKKNVVLEAPEHIVFFGNEGALASAIENVTRNAIHYTMENSTVLISVTPAPDTIVIKICDSGPGLAEDQLQKIFIPFYRVSEARERQTGGTGVGLAIAARVVQSHGGIILAHNRPNGGLEIEMRLPRASGRGKIKLT